MIRVGLGVDAHAFGRDRALLLGGVEIPGSRGLAGHSDGDVLSHAVADALLSAAGLSDLGSSFPNTDRWRAASSLEILSAAGRMVTGAGWSVANVDATVVAEAPALAPYREQMIVALAGALEIDRSRVWVKATTTDGLGFCGRSEGMAALAVVLVERD